MKCESKLKIIFIYLLNLVMDIFYYYYFKFWSGVWELSKVNIQGLPNGIGYFIIST